LGWLWLFTQILRPDWKGFPRTNLLGLIISDEGKKFYNIDTCVLYYKHMTIVNDDSSVIIK